MSLSPFNSFQSRFVTYLLNFPRTKHVLTSITSLGRVLLENIRVTNLVLKVTALYLTEVKHHVHNS